MTRRPATFISDRISICSYATRPGDSRTLLHGAIERARPQAAGWRGGAQAAHSRTHREPARAGAGRLYEVFREQTCAGDRRSRIHVSEIVAERGTRETLH